MYVLSGLIAVNNVHSMYWKTSKDFRDPTAYHIRDSLFINDPSDPVGELLYLIFFVHKKSRFFININVRTMIQFDKLA